MIQVPLDLVLLSGIAGRSTCIGTQLEVHMESKDNNNEEKIDLVELTKVEELEEKTAPGEADLRLAY